MAIAESYLILKTVHVTCVALSGAFFFLRGLWMMRASPRLARRWVRISPHVIDTLLLLSAVMLAATIDQFPGRAAWLTAKVTGMFAYIGLGMVAIRRGRTRRIRIVAWLAALLAYGYIVSVALTRNPFIFL